jgi:hypothetical protein
MDADDRYQAWKQRRAAAEVPEGFADRVMQTVRGVQGRQQRHAPAGVLGLLFSSRLSKVAVCTLAVAACVVRVAAVVAVLLPE